MSNYFKLISNTMKTVKFLFMCCAIFSVFTLSCRKDDNDTENESYLKIGDVNYDLSAGIYSIEYDDENNFYSVLIFLYDGFKNVYLFDGDSFYGEGTGSGIMFWLNSSSNEIIPKHYINGSEDLYDCEEIVYVGDAVYGTEEMNYYGESNDEGVGGVTISKDGDNYEITFDFEGYVAHDDQIQENVEITGHYYGKLVQ